MMEAWAAFERGTERRSRSKAATIEVQIVACIPMTSRRIIDVSVTARGIQLRIASCRQTHVAFAASGAEPAWEYLVYEWSERKSG